jgi:hypothetical protein
MDRGRASSRTDTGWWFGIDSGHSFVGREHLTALGQEDAVAYYAMTHSSQYEWVSRIPLTHGDLHILSVFAVRNRGSAVYRQRMAWVPAVFLC